MRGERHAARGRVVGVAVVLAVAVCVIIPWRLIVTVTVTATGNTRISSTNRVKSSHRTIEAIMTQ